MRQKSGNRATISEKVVKDIRRATRKRHSAEEKIRIVLGGLRGEGKGIRHVYIKPSSPQLNGKVERSHRSDQQEFYQLLSYKGDVDLEVKLAQWESFYNFARPHGACNGKTPYEALREKP